jgi:hypothetical protein
MSKQLIKILYNPSSISSAKSEQMSFDEGFLNSKIGAEDPLLLIAELSHTTIAERICYDKLVNLKRALSLPQVPKNRPTLLINFNVLLKYLATHYTGNMNVFQCAVQIIMLLKEHVETRPQAQSQSLRSEWVELEKSIYTLSSWENQLDYFWANLH